MCVNSKNWLSVNAILFRFIILPHLSNSIILVIVAIRVGTLWLHMTINLSILSPLIKVNYVSFEIIINTRDLIYIVNCISKAGWTFHKHEIQLGRCHTLFVASSIHQFLKFSSNSSRYLLMANLTIINQWMSNSWKTLIYIVCHFCIKFEFLIVILSKFRIFKNGF